MSRQGRRAEDRLPHGPNARLINDAVVRWGPDGKIAGVEARLSLPDTLRPLIDDHFPFPARPVLMGVLGLEGLMQAGASGALQLPVFAGKLLVPTSLSARFREPIPPDEEVALLIDEVKPIRDIGGRANGKVIVNGGIHTSASFSFMAVDPEKFGQV